jgi:hypothetical protein
MTRPPPTKAPRCERSEEIDDGRMPCTDCIAKAVPEGRHRFVRISEQRARQLSEIAAIACRASMHVCTNPLQPLMPNCVVPGCLWHENT